MVSQGVAVNRYKNYPVVCFYLLFAINVLLINRGSTWFSPIAYIVIVFLAILSSPETDTVLMFCLMPLPRIFMISSGMMTLVPIIQVIICLKFLVGNGLEKRQFACLFVLTIYSGLNEMLRFSTIGNTLQYVLTIFTMIVVASILSDELRRNCYITFVISTVLSAVVGHLCPSVSNYVALYGGEYNTRFQGLMTDPGSFGQSVVCAIAIIMTMLFFKDRETEAGESQHRMQRVLSIGAIIILFYYMLLSGTRACMLALAIVYVVVLYWLLRAKKRWIQVVGVCCCIASLLILPTIVNNLFDALLSTHGGEMLSDDRRLTIWRNYLSEMVAHPEILVFGVGMDSCNALGQVAGIGNPHNVLIEKAIECGLIGFLLNLGIFYPLFKRKDMRLSNVFTLPFYVFLSTLLVYGSVGVWLPYLLLSLINEKMENDYEIDEIISDG